MGSTKASLWLLCFFEAVVDLHACVVQRIPGKERSAISSLAWTYEPPSGQWRLFSGGLDGLLTEWDLKALRPRSVLDSFGGAVWSLAVEPKQSEDGKFSKSWLATCTGHAGFFLLNIQKLKPLHLPAGRPQRVAVACDDGALRMFEAQDGVAGLQYAKTLPRTEGRVLSAAWHPDCSTIVSGTSAGVMHVWDVTSARELLRITAGADNTALTSCYTLPENH